ncbi:MAG TPA: methyl-accepting chemotaxis protein [Burkholderiaceae bacterium]|nr:methyl-accepting chemotaxis protein [Burkholderiaceae bacterium]
MANDIAGLNRTERTRVATGGTVDPNTVMGGSTVGPDPNRAFRITEFAPFDTRLPPGPKRPAAAAPTAARRGPQTQRVERRPAPPTRVALPSGGWIERFMERPLPVIGSRPAPQQVQVLAILLSVLLLFTVVIVAVDLRTGANSAQQIAIVGDTTMHTQRLAKAAPNAVRGIAPAFGELIDSRDQIDLNLAALANGDAARGLTASSPELQGPLARVQDRWRTTQAAASVIIAQQKTLTAFGDVLRRINDNGPRTSQLAEDVQNRKLKLGATARDVYTAGQLVMLNQRIGKSAEALVGGDKPSEESAVLLGRDVAAFHDLAQAMLSGSDALGVPATGDPDARAELQELLNVYGGLQASVGGVLGNLQSVLQAREGERTVLSESEPLRMEFSKLLAQYQAEQRGRVVDFWLMAIFGLAALLCMIGIAKVLLADSAKRAREADSGRAEAMRLEEEAKRSNELNQAAILRLMNELQEVADGNLTVQATVTEDITGAIADSVNYTVEELRGLVGRINTTAEQVNAASTQARDIATRLLTASEAQSREIRDTGEKVLTMAGQINDVSRSAGESAKVARASLEAAERGQRAVYNQISGMNEIREQIQETAKRIKRLGESSQEIGEIVELISDITEQTNVLALNAAIQAASAGEAGRGFSVVAEEVQRLADRSAEAAKQIGALVRTIQTDTHDAVAAMEKSTQGVVEGTKLSDAAGTALADIGRVSRQLAELIEQIAQNTSDQADSAGGVAHSIERILSVTEQTSQGTRQAAQSIGQLATLARELKASVARFRVS